MVPRRKGVSALSRTVSASEVEEGLSQLPMFDVHTHLTCGELGARGLHDILLYHMLLSDLYSAGCPDGPRLTEFPGAPSAEETEWRVARALPYLRKAANTSTNWMFRQVLRGLYGWEDTVTEDNWRRLDRIIVERSAEPGWADEVLRRLNIVRSCTEHVRRAGGVDDHRFQYSVEWAVFTRPGSGMFDTPLFELERCWGTTPGPPPGAGEHQRPVTDRVVRSASDAKTAMEEYVRNVPEMVVSMATHISTDIRYREVSDAEFEDALSLRATAGPLEQDVYSSYLNELLLSELERRRADVVFVFSTGAEELPFATGGRLSQSTVGQVGKMIERHPGLRFECMLATPHTNHAFCGLARQLPNLTMVGYWWHGFYPEAIRQMMAERLDMLPVNRQIGFFSDAYTIEWVYGKAVLVRRQMAQLLAARISEGWYNLDEAVEIANEILYETPKGHVGDGAAITLSWFAAEGRVGW